MRSNVTGSGYYNSEPRQFNRGFGRGSPRPYYPPQRQPSPQPSRRGDLFVEAGRLAAEYLVSNGLLSSNVLPVKYQNGSLRYSYGESQEHRSSQDREPLDDRSAATGLPRAATPDGVSSSRTSPDEQDRSMSGSYSRERRRNGSSRSYNFDWGRENGREGSLPEKATSSEPMEVDSDKHSKDNGKDVDDVSKDGGHMKSLELESCPVVDSESNVTSTATDKDSQELIKPAGEMNIGSEETNCGSGNHDKEQEIRKEESPIHHSEETAILNEVKMDLIKVDSSSINNSPKGDLLMPPEENNIGTTGSDVFNSTKDDTTISSSGIASSSEILCSNYLGAAPSESFGDVGAINSASTVNQQKSVGSLAFNDRTFSIEEKFSGFSELGMCNSTSIGKDSDAKRALEDDSIREGAKKTKQWLSVAQSNEYFQYSDLSGKPSILPEKRVPINIFNESGPQERFTHAPSHLNGGVGSAVDQKEEKQLFSSSYKICDLNLMEASENPENHGVTASSMLYSSMSAPGKDPRVDFDLSMNNNCEFTAGLNDSGAGRKDIEIIDLESASLEEGKSYNTSARNMEAGNTNMDSFANNPQNPNDNADGQDGYSFMISELLGNDVPNCAVQPDMNAMHNEMGVHHGEAIFNEDDPIYMSLGEIPLTGLLQAWEQPTQERNPFEL